jgi:hypothetical protein
MLLMIQDKNSKMQINKKAIVGILFASIFAFSVVPYFNVSAQSAKCNPDALKPVSYGQRGAAVKNAQACLIEAGYNIPAGATGYYGAQTKNAVKKFYADWYGAWNGNSLGPKGVAELKSRLAAAFEEEEEQEDEPSTGSQTGGSQAGGQQGGVSPDQLMQVLQLLSQGKSSDALAALMALLTGQPIQLPAQTTTPSTQQPAEEGFLAVDKDPTVSAVTLREGETGKVVGLRFRADNGAVSVKSVFLRWAGSAAPYRVISALRVVDSQGNVLYQTNVGPTTFLQDSSLNYYLPISGLDVNVPKNGYNSIFVEVTTVNTKPSGVNSFDFKVKVNDVRARDGVGIDRFGPDSSVGDLTWTTSFQQTLANNARFIGSLNPNTPKQGYLFGNINDGLAQRVKVLSFDLTAKDDNIRVTQITGYATGSANVTAVYIARSGQPNPMDVRTPASGSGAFTFEVTPANFTINRDQTVTFDVLVDFVAPSVPQFATFTVNVSTSSGVSQSLGNNVSSATNVNSELMRVVRVGPEFSRVSADVQRSYNQQTNTSTVTSITYVVNITPRGGQVYIPTTSAATTTLSGGTSTSVSLDVKEVRLGTTLLSHDGTKYTLNENQTYQVTYEKIGPIAKYGGDVKVVSQLSEFIWSPDGTNVINADFLSGFPEYRVER